MVVSQPRISIEHESQQKELKKMLDSFFASEPLVSYYNLDKSIRVEDKAQAYDGMHLVADSNRTAARLIAEQIQVNINNSVH